MSTWRSLKEAGYSQGRSPQATQRGWARANGRKGGLASGVKRRQLARGRRDTHDGGLGVAKVYAPVPWLSRAESERVFRRLMDEEGIRFHRRGFETFDAVYRILKRWSMVKGQGFEITNENVSAALRAIGAGGSCRRTVQYTRQRLQRAQVLICAHVKRSGARRVPGHMDTIRVHLLRVRRSKDCTPPLRGTGQRSFVASCPVCQPNRNRNDGASRALSPPASPADGLAADAATGNGSNEGEGRGAGKDCTPRIAALQEAIRFQQLKLSYPGLAEPARGKLSHLRRTLEAELAGAAPLGRYRGDRC